MLEAYPLHDRLKAGKPSAGLILNFASAAMVEIASLMQFDFLVIDAEHGPLGPSEAEPMIRAAELSRIAPFVRLPSKHLDALRYLDIGAAGIIFPNIESAHDARDAVAATFFPPLGNRGLAPNTRAAGYGISMPYKNYLEHANGLLMAVMLIETRQGIERIDEILEVPGVSAVLVGPMDLSASYGVPADPGHPDVDEAARHVVNRCAAAGMPLILGAGTVEQGKANLAKGASMVVTPAAGLFATLGRDFTCGLRGPGTV